ncbi:MAG TPA: RodZ domain-containing protein [Gaiellales bacterium]|jgi:cytoskeletal protein RodZ|nr:RodZ domain-containing protein [Gaiellales bacterium]
MFEIGSALREARERRGLSYSQVEEGTKIRARYIRALEEEDFGVLPGATYSKGFLRAYADYLGLDGHLFIDEFNSRYHDPRNDDDRPIYPPSRRTPARHRRETSIVLIALAAIVAIASLVFLGAGSGGTPNTPLPTPSTTTHSPKTTQGSTASSGSSQGTTSSKKHKKAVATTYKISITAANGDSYLSAHLGSAAGPAAKTIHHTDLSEYLLQQGEQAVIQATGPVVVSLGAPGNVTITVAGHPQTLPHGISSFKITKQGIAKA